MTTTFKILPSTPYPLGIKREGKTLYAAMISESENCGIILYSSKTDCREPLKIAFPSNYKIGHVYSMKIEGIPHHYTGYQLYKDEDVLPDVYGFSYIPHPYGEELQPSDMIGLLETKSFDWGNDTKPLVPFSDAIFYGLHVRGFTKASSSKCRHKGTFLGLQEKLNYLEDLGITSIVLMPAYEFIENEKAKESKASQSSQYFAKPVRKNSFNYWGYKSAFYYAPKASYAATKDVCREFKQLVKTCHAKGMELFMQFYFPYEVQEPEIIRILEHWVMEYHIDGFQILAGHINVHIIKDAPSLADTKIIFRDFQDFQERNDGLSVPKKVNKRLCVFQDGSINDFRRFLKGDENTLDAVMYHFRKNGTSIAHMNSIADFNTFRVADMVSYDYKHNEANGEKNSDGNSYNFSWNCGVEGPTKKKAIQQLRIGQMKNALSFVFLSQSTPYLFMGDEMGFSQQGNNNPYNQDNEISWLDWKCLRKNSAVYMFTKALIAYRKAHRILHMDHYLSGSDIMGCGYPNISFHGEEAYKTMFEPYRRELGVLLCGKYARERDGKEDKMLYIIFNMHWEKHIFALPKLPKGEMWNVALQTTEEALEIIKDKKTTEEASEKSWIPRNLSSHEKITIPARCVVVLES